MRLPGRYASSVPPSRWSKLRLAVAAAGMLLGVAACSEPSYTCSSNAQCVDEDGTAGICEPTGYCSFADDDCSSGRRYGSLSGDLGDLCVSDSPESPIDHLGSVSATATDSNILSVEVNGLPSAGADRTPFLLLSVASQNYEPVEQVSGGGATWSLVHEQCSARQITMTSVWLGVLSGDASGVVEVTLESSAETSIAAVSAFDAPTGSPAVQLLGSSNSAGSGAGCPGTGTDTSSFEVPAAPTRSGSYVLVTVAPRHRTATAEEDAVVLLAERVETGSAPAGLALFYYPRSTLQDDLASGDLSGDEDWAAAAFELY